MHIPTARRARVAAGALSVALSLAFGATVARAQVVRAAAGSAAAIQSTVDDFRTALGPLNANVAGSLGTGRREINWDGVPDANAGNLPANFFNTNSPRGAVFGTPGTGF